MADNRGTRSTGRRDAGTMRGSTGGRAATTAAILDAAQELFSAQGYEAVSVRAVAERAGVSHALVHRYLGSKPDVFRAVLTRNERVILDAAPDENDLLLATSLMLRHGITHGRDYIRLLAHAASYGTPYDRSTGRFAATERLVELAQRAAASAPAAERAEKDLDPRLVVACVVALFLGWGTTSSWVLPAVGLDDPDEAEVLDALERVIRGILKDNIPGVEEGGSASH